MTSADAHKLVNALFAKWQERFDKTTPITLGFVSVERMNEYGAQARYLQVVDAELVNYVRTTWKHLPEMNINPSADNVLLVVCPGI